MISAIGIRNVRCGAKDAPGSLDGISLSVTEGQCLALCGPAGAGKATLLRLIARRTPPLSGAVCLFSRDIWLMSKDEAAGMVLPLSPAGPGLAGLTAGEIVGSAGRAGRPASSPAAHPAVVHAALRQVGLGAMRDPAFGLLSAEDRLRVLVARALVLRPRIVLLPGAAGADELGLQIALLGDLRDAGTTVVVTAERAGPAAARVDRVVEMDRGRIVADSGARPAAAAQFRQVGTAAPDPGRQPVHGP